MLVLLLAFDLRYQDLKAECFCYAVDSRESQCFWKGQMMDEKEPFSEAGPLRVQVFIVDLGLVSFILNLDLEKP